MDEKFHEKTMKLASTVFQIMFILNSHFDYKNYHQYSNFVNVYNYNETLEITFWYVDGCWQKKVVLKKDWEKWYCNMRIIISWNIFCLPLSDKSLQNETSVNLEVKNVIFLSKYKYVQDVLSIISQLRMTILVSIPIQMGLTISHKKFSSRFTANKIIQSWISI